MKLNVIKDVGGTAAVLIEPVGPESGTRPFLKEYNSQVRELCTEYETLLISDEVVTGFRIDQAGSRLYTSMAITDDVIEDALERFDRVIGNFE